MSRDGSEMRFVERVVEDLRFLHGSILHSLGTLRTRALALLAGELTIITFLFNMGGFGFDRWSVASWIFFTIGIMIFMGSLLAILWLLHPVPVLTPPDTKDTRNMADRFCDDMRKYLMYMKSEYELAIESLGVLLSRRSRVFAWIIRLMPIAILIMVVLKYL